LASKLLRTNLGHGNQNKSNLVEFFIEKLSGEIKAMGTKTNQIQAMQIQSNH
jgi:hypothetical protein